MGLIRIADTRQPSTLDRRTKLIRDDFNLIERNAVFDFEYIDDDSFKIVPKQRSNDSPETVIPFRIPNIPYAPIVNESDDWTIDLTTSTIDLDNNSGGIIDGLARANSDYIIYSFLDENLKFAGIGVGQKPLTSFTVIGGGTAVRGTTVTFTVTTAYRFVAGARVVVRNTNGTNQQDYEFNWGTINTIISDASISIDMDSNSEYGVNITSVTGGEILQWNKYRPYIVTTTSQSLYQPYYTVLGEVFGGKQNKVWQLYKKTDKFRIINEVVFNLSVSTFTNVLQLSRVIPLWSNGVSLRTNYSGGVINDTTTIADSTGAITNWCLMRRDTGVTLQSYNFGFIPPDRSARIWVNKNNTTGFSMVAMEHKLPTGGMYV